MMQRKALLFDDEAIAAKILRSVDPKRHRALGRELKGFDKGIWHSHCLQFSFDANYAKFFQNAPLKKILLDSGDALLAEVSPYDRTWGIGFSSLHASALNPQQWRGKNLAGESLMQVRAALKK